eukprot:1179056-Prorocentrum_minimum.AAC.3
MLPPARSDTFTLLMYYVADEPLTFGAPFDNGAFRVFDVNDRNVSHATPGEEATLQVRCSK